MLAIYTTLIYIHIFVSIMLVALIILQKTTGNGLFTSSQTNVFLSSAEVAQVVTRITTTLVAIFFINTLALAKISYSMNKGESVVATQEIIPDSTTPTIPTE